MGATGLMQPWILLPLLFLAAVGWLWHGRRGDPWTLWKNTLCRHASFLIILSLLMLFFLAPVWCPPIGWDALTYHLTLPERWMHDGFPAVYMDLPYSGFPSAGEFIYWLLIRLGDSRTPGMFIWLIFLLIGLHVYGRLEKHCGRWFSAAVAFAVLLAPVSLMLLKNTYVEPLLLLNILAGIELNERNMAAKWPANLLWGILLGSCGALKLNGVIAAGGLLMLSPVVEPCTWQERGHRAVIIGGIAVLSLFPFYLRPWVATGNPFFPFFASWFGQDNAFCLSSEFHHQLAQGKYGLQALSGWLAGILLLAWRGDLYDSCFGWPWLILLALALPGAVIALRRGNYNTLRLYGMLLVFYLGWGFTAQQARFLLPAMVLLLFGAIPVLRELPIRWRPVLAIVLLAGTLSALPIPLRHAMLCWRFLTGDRVTLEDYIYSGTGPGYLAAAEMTAVKTPPDARIALLFDHRTLYIPRHAILATPYFQPCYFTPLPTDSTQMEQLIRQAGFSHLLLGDSSKNPDRPKIYYEWMGTMLLYLNEMTESGRAELLWQGEGYFLFRILSTPAPARK